MGNCVATAECIFYEIKHRNFSDWEKKTSPDTHGEIQPRNKREMTPRFRDNSLTMLEPRICVPSSGQRASPFLSLANIIRYNIFIRVSHSPPRCPDIIRLDMPARLPTVKSRLPKRRGCLSPSCYPSYSGLRGDPRNRRRGIWLLRIRSPEEM